MNAANFIVVDIETGPLDKETVLARSKTLKMPSKLSKGETEESLREEYEQECLGKAALSAETGEVLAIGIRGVKDGQLQNVIWHGVEYDTLTHFWRLFNDTRDRGRTMVGFNILEFDLPFLICRSWYLGVKVPGGVMDKWRWWPSFVVDLMQVWKLGRYRSYISLDMVARCCGLQGKTEGMSGADFAEAWKNDRETAEAYLLNDLEITWNIGVRLGVIASSLKSQGDMR